MTPLLDDAKTDLAIQRADIAALRAVAYAAALRNPPAPNTIQLVLP